jgi:hypothetical protein
MRRYNVGVGEGRIVPFVVGAPEPRRVDLVGVEAHDDQDAFAKVRDEWRARYGDEPRSALGGISPAY